GPADDRAFGMELVRELDMAGCADDSAEFIGRMYKKTGATDLRFDLARRLWESGRSAEVVDLLGALPMGPEARSEVLAVQAISLRAVGRIDDAKRIAAALHERSGDAS